MAYKLIETQRAEQDLAEILEYLAYDLKNPQAAASFADEVEQCYDRLEQMPFLYQPCWVPHLEYRRATVQNYIMIYKVDEEKEAVNILRFFYGRRNYERLI